MGLEPEEDLMPHINLDNDLPGVVGLLHYRPETGRPLSALAETLLRSPNTLSPGERELIAAYVSRRNDCAFCAASHSAFAAAQLPEGMALVDAVCTDLDQADVTPKMRALLHIAGKVQQSGKAVTAADVDAARAAGASDTEIHDSVLIAAVFCMFNRYVDGLDTVAPDDAEGYAQSAQAIVEYGYLAIAP
jgi:uncharacterized peroxidase-related enzyme